MMKKPTKAKLNFKLGILGIILSLQCSLSKQKPTLKISPKFTGKKEIKGSNHYTIDIDSLFDIQGPLWSMEIKRKTKGGKILEAEAMSVTSRITPIMSKRDLRFSQEALEDTRKMIDWELEREH